MNNYYQDQLGNIETKGMYPAMVKIRCTTGETKWLTLNDESANELVKFLKENFNIED